MSGRSGPHVPGEKGRPSRIQSNDEAHHPKRRRQCHEGSPGDCYVEDSLGHDRPVAGSLTGHEKTRRTASITRSTWLSFIEEKTGRLSERAKFRVATGKSRSRRS